MSSREALALGTDSRPPVLFRGSYPQWKKRFLDWVDRQTDGEIVLVSYKDGPDYPTNPINGDVIPPESYNATQQKRSKADKLARSYLYQALPDDIYCNVDSYETGKDIWDELERQIVTSVNFPF